ncbi:unnamed protein product [Paramecium primaurelia]|uniref:Uncharacterized protein n=1 Tax=Paramecium primaurelia TaxID=5886 RepID=A0A8S1PRM6_PARPR|nr:unnamed protein product [Paramecium primaurelia]
MVIVRIKSFILKVLPKFRISLLEITTYIQHDKMQDYGYFKSLFMKMIKNEQCSIFQIYQGLQSQNKIEISNLIENFC